MTIIEQEEELENWTGRELGCSEWLLISQEMIDAFADATGDRQWIHTQPEQAAKSSFGGTIAHGYFLLSLIPRLKVELVEFSFPHVAINYGCNKVRFLFPVKSGSEVRLRMRLDSAEKAPGGVKLITTNTLELKEPARAAMVAETITLLK